MKVKHILLTVLLTLIYAVCYVVIKAGLAYAPPLLFGGLRTFIGGSVLLGYAWVKREPLMPAKTSWKGLLVLALVGTTVVFGAMFLSPGMAGAGIASVLGNSQALIALALAAVFLAEKLTTGKTTAIALGLTGVVLVAYPALEVSNAESIVGIGLALAVSTGTAVTSIIVKRARIRRDLLAFAGWQLVLGSLPLLLFSQLFERGEKLVMNLEFAGLLLFLALVGTSFSTAAWYSLVGEEDVGRLSLFFFLVPIFGLGLAALVFREAISLYQGVGVVVILAGIGILIWEAARTPARAYVYCPFCHAKVALDA